MPSMFEFPLNILAFNRPKYFEKVLKSLTLQTVQLDPSLTKIGIDGYRGSRDESCADVIEILRSARWDFLLQTRL